MKALIKFALAAVMLITTLTAQAGWVSGHYRSNGTYVAPLLPLLLRFRGK